MSHELRTPLHAILGFAQLIEAGSPEPTPGQKRSIDQILKAGWHLLELINEILDLSVIESGKLSLLLEPVSLAEVLAECELMIEPQAQKYGIRVAIAKLGAGCFVNAERLRLKQVLINLLSNAVKYNKAGGAVAVECTPRPPDSIRISIRDTGPGLAPEQLPLLFDAFNRLGQEAKAEEGTGMGLVVSKRLVELMGGEIGAESTLGEGSVFWIELKGRLHRGGLAEVADSAALAEVGAQHTATAHTVLYVEDNPANLMLVEDILARRADIRMLSASDGASGIELARSAVPDVILLDINMQGLDGNDVLRILGQAPATARIPVIALTANAMPDDIAKGLEAGFFRYLTKPIKIDEFMATLDVALKSSQRP
ncbi:MAG: response regulator [Sulfuritalea sp.]|nr:response regulator [Sulfuritalea sp.]